MLFPNERGVYLNEQSCRLYNVSSYFISKLLIDIPQLILTIFGFAITVYFPVGFQSDFVKFISFFIVVLAVSICGHGLGLIVATTVPSPAFAALLAPMAIAPFILFSHIAIPGRPGDKITPVLRPFQIASPFWWGLDALMITEFSGLELHCRLDELYAVPSVKSGILYLCHFMYGEEVLNMYSIDKSNFIPSVIYLFAIATCIIFSSGLIFKIMSIRVASCVRMDPPKRDLTSKNPIDI